MGPSQLTGNVDGVAHRGGRGARSRRVCEVHVVGELGGHEVARASDSWTLEHTLAPDGRT